LSWVFVCVTKGKNKICKITLNSHALTGNKRQILLKKAVFGAKGSYIAHKKAAAAAKVANIF
jgi:hypothetical protein